MDRPLRIGIIGGAGWLGGAIADAALKAGIVEPQFLSLSHRSERPDRFPLSVWTTDNQALCDRSDVIILAVRPDDWPAIEADARDKLVISVMAGIRLEALCRHHRTGRAVRALPNAAAEVAMSYTPWIATSEVGDPDRAIVETIFNACGLQDQVATEAEIDYLTGLSGSGPAFPALLADAMMQHAVSHGLAPEMARRAVKTLLVGTGRLLEQRDDCPGDIVRTFLDYRGTTAAAIEEMRTAGFQTAIARGLTAAHQKSIRMGDAS